MADPVVWESVSRTLSQQQRLSTLVTPEQSPAVTDDLFSDAYACPSRTSSQRKRLNRFTKELQKYTDFTGARGKRPMVSSTATVSRNTLHTVDELLPYHHEFQSAGLAVTSAEQHGKSSGCQVGQKRPGRPTSSAAECRAGAKGRDRDDQGRRQANDADIGRFTSDQDGPSHFLANEAPPHKEMTVSPRKTLPWLRKNHQPTRLPELVENEPSTMDLAGPVVPTGPPPPRNPQSPLDESKSPGESFDP